MADIIKIVEKRKEPLLFLLECQFIKAWENILEKSIYRKCMSPEKRTDLCVNMGAYLVSQKVPPRLQNKLEKIYNNPTVSKGLEECYGNSEDLSKGNFTFEMERKFREDCYKLGFIISPLSFPSRHSALPGYLFKRVNCFEGIGRIFMSEKLREVIKENGLHIRIPKKKAFFPTIARFGFIIVVVEEMDLSEYTQWDSMREDVSFGEAKELFEKEIKILENKSEYHIDRCGLNLYISSPTYDHMLIIDTECGMDTYPEALENVKNYYLEWRNRV